MKGVYIHIPFCVKKCDYCDFVSFPGCEDVFEKYAEMLEKEIAKHKCERADSVFIGGGTPTRLPDELLKRILNSIRENFVLAPNCEFTVEANPATVDLKKAKLLRECGVNRVSIGVQSFSDRELKAVGRIHSAEEAKETIECFREAGFENISIDLMMSLPYQTEESFKKSLSEAMALPITHLSVYSLIIEENTPIKKKYDDGTYALPDEDTDRRLYAYTKEFLEKHGFKRYEISNYAKDGYESRHNLKYWDMEEYIGLGLAAHSFDGKVRRKNTENLSQYLAGEFSESVEELTEDDMMSEFMFLALRKTEGADSEKFKRFFGRSIESVYGRELEKFTALSLMEKRGQCYALTDRGLDVANTIMCEFLR